MDDATWPLLLMGAFRAMTDQTHAELAEEGFVGVRASHGFAMQALGSGCTSAELATRLGVSKQAAAKTVRALEELGFVERQPNPRDARERRVVRTPRGQEMLRRSAASFERQVAQWRATVGDAAVDALADALRQTSARGRGPLAVADFAE